MESTNKLFKQLETHRVSPSDVFILDHMKTLLLLHDTKRLKSALDVFPEHCRMPLGMCSVHYALGLKPAPRFPAHFGAAPLNYPAGLGALT